MAARKPRAIGRIVGSIAPRREDAGEDISTIIRRAREELGIAASAQSVQEASNGMVDRDGNLILMGDQVRNVATGNYGYVPSGAIGIVLSDGPERAGYGGMFDESTDLAGGSGPTVDVAFGGGRPIQIELEFLELVNPPDRKYVVNIFGKDPNDAKILHDYLLDHGVDNEIVATTGARNSGLRIFTKLYKSLRKPAVPGRQSKEQVCKAGRKVEVRFPNFGSADLFSTTLLSLYDCDSDIEEVLDDTGGYDRPYMVIVEPTISIQKIKALAVKYNGVIEPVQLPSSKRLARFLKPVLAKRFEAIAKRFQEVTGVDVRENKPVAKMATISQRADDKDGGISTLITRNCFDHRTGGYKLEFPSKYIKDTLLDLARRLYNQPNYTSSTEMRAETTYMYQQVDIAVDQIRQAFDQEPTRPEFLDRVWNSVRELRSTLSAVNRTNRVLGQQLRNVARNSGINIRFSSTHPASHPDEIAVEVVDGDQADASVLADQINEQLDIAPARIEGNTLWYKDQ